VLVVGGAEAEAAGLEGWNASVEVLLARSAEEALEKLGRNRRIDAVLLLAGAETAAIVEAIREDSPAHPPIFVPEGPQPAPPGVHSLPAASTSDLLGLLLKEMEGDQSRPAWRLSFASRRPPRPRNS